MAASAYDSPFQTPTPTLFGREREQSLLRGWLRNALAGRGRLVLISGDAGIGKTTLVTWLMTEARSLGAEACVGHCDDLTQMAPYRPWRNALARVAPLADVVSLLSLTDANRAAVSSPALLFDHVAAGIAAAAANQPLVVVLEDLHWSEPASLELLHAVARGIDAWPVLLVATYREDDLLPQQPLFEFVLPLARGPHTERIALGPLADTAVLALVRARCLLAPADESRLVAYLHERAAGNPFYLTELLRTLEADRILAPTDGGWTLGDLAQTSLPPLVRQLIERRLARLDEATQRHLEIAAVIGSEAELDLWMAASDAGRDQLLSTADRAVSAHLAWEHSLPTTLVFSHALVRDTLYFRQPLARRRQIHQRIAEVLANSADPPLSLVASHFAAADDIRSVDWLVRSGEQALALYAPGDAITALKHAQVLAARFAQHLPAAVYRTRAAAAAMIGDFDLARRDYEIALERARETGNHRIAWQSLLDLGMLWAERDYDRTIGYYELALKIARELGDDEAIAYSLNRIANWHVNRDEPDAALPLHEEALALFRARGDQAGIADTLDFLGLTAYLGGDFRRAIAYCEEAIPIMRDLGDRQRLSSCLAILATSGGDVTWIASPPYREPAYWIRACEDSLDQARDIAWPAGEAFAHICLGMVTVARGHLGRAMREAELGLEIARRIGHEQWIIAAQQTIATIWIEMLEPERALPLLEDALAAARRSGSQFWTNTIVAILTSLHIARDEPERAAAVLSTVSHSGQDHRYLSRRQCRFAAAELRLAQGDAEGALRIVDELAATRPNPATDDAMPQLLKLRGDALRRLDRLTEAAEVYRVAAAGARLLEYRPWLWRIEQARGDLHAAMGQTASAEEAYRLASAVIDELAASIEEPSRRDAFRARARARLPHYLMTEARNPTFDRLTPREREVLQHLVAGKTDREIAAALSVSPRTVMNHVASILAKLGVASRTAAATLAVRERSATESATP